MNPRRIGDRLVWVVRSSDLTHWATWAPKNNYDTGLVKTKFNKVNENNKFFFYKNIRILSCIFQFWNKKALFIKWRISEYKLQIETGRYIKTLHNQTLCLRHKVVEDEEHFLLPCKNNETLRNILFKDLLFWKNNETLRNILFKDLLFWKYNETLKKYSF